MVLLLHILNKESHEIQFLSYTKLLPIPKSHLPYLLTDFVYSHILSFQKCSTINLTEFPTHVLFFFVTHPYSPFIYSTSTLHLCIRSYRVCFLLSKRLSHIKLHPKDARRHFLFQSLYPSSVKVIREYKVLLHSSDKTFDTFR